MLHSSSTDRKRGEECCQVYRGEHKTNTLNTRELCTNDAETSDRQRGRITVMLFVRHRAEERNSKTNSISFLLRGGIQAEMIVRSNDRTMCTICCSSRNIFWSCVVSPGCLLRSRLVSSAIKDKDTKVVLIVPVKRLIMIIVGNLSHERSETLQLN